VEFQYEDWIKVDNNYDLCIVRSVGGSKTFDGVQWAVLRGTMSPDEPGAWLASAGGQLDQARIYFNNHPFVRFIKGGMGKEIVYLYSGGHIILRGLTRSLAGIRLDWVILDEEEMLEPRQIQLYYPQIAARMAHSDVGKFIHLGTMRQDAPIFMENIESYASSINAWDKCPWLVKAGTVQRYIDEKVKPEWELDLYYRCIPTVPGGSLFNNLHLVSFKVEFPDGIPEAEQYGIDFGNKDVVVGNKIIGKRCYILEEYSVEIENYNDALDFLKGNLIQAEAGLYNDSDRYSAKSFMMQDRIGAVRRHPTHAWKSKQQMYARGLQIYIDKSVTPNTYKDLKSATYGPDGIYFKHPTKAPCHNLDAFFLSLQVQGSIVDGQSTKQLGRRRQYVGR